MKKEWFFDRICGELVAVYAEDGIVTEVSVESECAPDALGNIYKGRVSNIVPGMQAAFVSCGMERNCYLPLAEEERFTSYDGSGDPRGEAPLREGDEILVQLVKFPRGNKGAKVSRELSFIGRDLIFLPDSDFLGISRKIEAGEAREALLKEADKLRGKGEGFIVRTAAQGATHRRLKTEADYLRRMYRSVLEAARTAPVGSAVYREYDLPVKIMRDLPAGGITRIVVGDEELYERVVRLARMRADVGEKKVVLYRGERSMIAEFGLSEQLCSLADLRVPLPNGGHLVIDTAEAMTVIDVNTGRYTGESDLESTVFDTNMEAAREIARQVRLRNIGGIVAVDFIDMAEEGHRNAVDAELARALAADRSKCRSFPMSELCVAMFTRKRTNDDLRSFLLQPCTHCARQGYTLSDRFMSMRIRSAVSDVFAEGYSSALVEINPELLRAVLAGRYFSDDLRGRWRGKRVYFLPRAEHDRERFVARGDDSEVLSLPDDAQIAY